MGESSTWIQGCAFHSDNAEQFDQVPPGDGRGVGVHGGVEHGPWKKATPLFSLPLSGPALDVRGHLSESPFPRDGTRNTKYKVG